MRISLRYVSVNTDSETDSGDRYYPPTAGRAGPRQCQTPVKAPREVKNPGARSGSKGKTSGTYRTQSKGGRKRASGRRKPTQPAVMRRQAAKEQREVEKMERFEQEFAMALEEELTFQDEVQPLDDNELMGYYVTTSENDDLFEGVPSFHY